MPSHDTSTDDSEDQKIKTDEIFKTCQTLHSKSYPGSSLDFAKLDLSQRMKPSRKNIGRGTYSDVYKGSLDDGARVAVKVLRLVAYSPMTEVEYKDTILRFFRELNHWYGLEHVNIARLLGFTLRNGRIGLVSLWYPNGNVVEYLKTRPQASKPDLILDVAQGVEYLHTHPQPLIHADLKGVNILIDENGVACLGDFGISKRINDINRKTGFTTASGVTGTLRWMAPELLTSASLTPASDIYSFAGVIIEIWCPGKSPYHYISKDTELIMMKHGGELPDRSQYPEFCYQNTLWNLVIICLSLNPDERPIITAITQMLHAAFELSPRAKPSDSRRPSIHKHSGSFSEEHPPTTQPYEQCPTSSKHTTAKKRKVVNSGNDIESETARPPRGTSSRAFSSISPSPESSSPLRASPPFKLDEFNLLLSIAFSRPPSPSDAKDGAFDYERQYRIDSGDETTVHLDRTSPSRDSFDHPYIARNLEPEGLVSVGGAKKHVPSHAGDILSPEMKIEVDVIFLKYLNRICSNLQATDAKGEAIHQLLMAKKMARLAESPDFRPFKFRIQPFTNGFVEELQQRGYDGDTLPVKKIKAYLSYQTPYIARFNEDGKKFKSKGSHIWIVEAKRVLRSLDSESSPDWIFKKCVRKITGHLPSVAYVGHRWAFEPKIWDPQLSSTDIHASFNSPALPSWLSWNKQILEGIPGPDSTSCEVTVEAWLTQDSQETTLRMTFPITVVPLPGRVASPPRPSPRSRRSSLDTHGGTAAPHRFTGGSYFTPSNNRLSPVQITTISPPPPPAVTLAEIAQVVKVLVNAAHCVAQEAHAQVVNSPILGPAQTQAQTSLAKQQQVLSATAQAVEREANLAPHTSRSMAASSVLVAAGQQVVHLAAWQVEADRTALAALHQQASSMLLPPPPPVSISDVSAAVQSAVAHAVAIAGPPASEVEVMMTASALIRQRSRAPSSRLKGSPTITPRALWPATIPPILHPVHPVALPPSSYNIPAIVPSSSGPSLSSGGAIHSFAGNPVVGQFNPPVQALTPPETSSIGTSLSHNQQNLLAPTAISPTEAAQVIQVLTNVSHYVAQEARTQAYNTQTLGLSHAHAQVSLARQQQVLATTVQALSQEAGLIPHLTERFAAASSVLVTTGQQLVHQAARQVQAERLVTQHQTSSTSMPPPAAPVSLSDVSIMIQSAIAQAVAIAGPTSSEVEVMMTANALIQQRSGRLRGI